MNQPPSRRGLLRLAAASAAATPLTYAIPVAHAAPALSASATALPVAAPATWAVQPFPLDQVTLGDGVFRRKRDLMLEYARSYPADRILAVFRANAGIDTRGAQPPGGWETSDGNLRGHFGGHFLTLVAQAYADTREAALKTKLDYLVTALGECQQALADHGSPRPSHPGFLAAYPETQFVLLESYTTYPTIWAPYYTCHKIMRGLLDAHTLTGNQQALTIASKMGDWVHSRLSRLPQAQLDRMWSIYIAGEYGGMNEVLADLYALTGRAEHLAAARCFDNTALLDACGASRDILDGRHANQHIPQFTGYIRLFDHTGEAEYATAARNFWGMVAGPRTYSLGGTGQGEMFRARNAIAATLGDNNAETCATYNMLKLSRQLFFHTPDPAYMDYYERGLTNHILASRRDARSTTSPEVTYFVGMGPGVVREYDNTGTCCGGTGMENHTKYQDSVYFRSADGNALYVNLYLASTLRWPERGLVVDQTSDFPNEGVRTLTFREGGGSLDLKLRVPSWATGGFTVTVNGVPQQASAVPGSYLTLSRNWQRGDRITVSAPYRLRVERALDDPTVQSLFHGPVLLVARSQATSFRTFSFYKDFTLQGDLAASVRPEGRPLYFTTHGLTLAPFHVADTARYHAYFRRSEPVVVFGTATSGVPNRARTDGLTFLDVLWARAPFAAQGAFLDAVRVLADSWQSQGLFSRAERDAVVAASVRAGLRR
ncbi:glycoside hydrolase family 127 protein [Streptomyces sp. WI04-05B]|uniref:glycoside hydrolase family 127 protein n=1 Tax=Streptomyces TaxID=1883 RepID=UPI0029B95CD1|nr:MULTISPECIES: beta-L-arabinofuranosidase domain-containing protein [unclassified Streptomyces]MDX2546195.1 glycoside hydrolase family 127 protein [Streptomyces sp. WI04-05B]MDX2583218.1 glycoside hydrolase family 127 protein [Streptomyces sp. WI04-05A]